ncbi:porin family protein [Aureimonas fodinaquatilis]|uniref:Porin family protein n=1 Tax=Aureimonas fodinaquatilis TaxID=2565783 RepID=A0A5B0DZF1_9HYPH|nr:outer membrane beta-barrel protein [Aureimonas fodinaquatilis]KAA0971131.1 porin family protein [Aureimonas fodinaquatilis]
MAVRHIYFAGLCLIAAPAWAADGDFLSAAPEIGQLQATSGWYARADLNYSFEQSIKGDRVYVSPAGAEGGSAYMGKEPISGGVGIGYQFNSIFRADMSARYGQNDVFAVGDTSLACGVACRIEASTSQNVLDLDVNLYADLGTIMGFTPYVGAGLGGSYVSYDSVGGELCGVTACLDQVFARGDSDWRLSWSLMAGVAYSISEQLMLDLGYRYTDIAGGDALSGQLQLAGGGLQDFTLKDNGIHRHTVSAGLRFRFQ